jgi:hypothetical protein
MSLTPPLQNTGQEFDGSDSGARPDEAVSWGKIRAGTESVKASRVVLALILLSKGFIGLCGCNTGVSVACGSYVCEGYEKMNACNYHTQLYFVTNMAFASHTIARHGIYVSYTHLVSDITGSLRSSLR